MYEAEYFRGRVEKTLRMRQAPRAGCVGLRQYYLSCCYTLVTRCVSVLNKAIHTLVVLKRDVVDLIVRSLCTQIGLRFIEDHIGLVRT